MKHPASITYAILLLAVQSVIHPTPGSASQQPGSTELIYLAGKDTLATEKVEVTESLWTGTFTWKGQPTVKWKQKLSGTAPGSHPGSYGLEVFPSGARVTGSPIQEATFTQSGDTIVIDIRTGDDKETQKVHSASGAYVIFNRSLANMALAAMHAVPEGNGSLAVFLAQGGQRLPVSVGRTADTMTVSMAGINMQVVLGSDRLPSYIRVPSQGLTVVRRGMSPEASGVSLPGATEGRAPEGQTPATAAATPGTMPRDYGAPPDAPYTASDVRVPTEQGYELAATLTRPKGAAAPPVVITISGSGLQDRDSQIPIVPGYAPFREMADTLSRRGIAVLRFDDRGFGESGGIATLDGATTADFADDVRSIVKWLRARSDIDPQRIFLLGHSEGGIIAPLVAADDPEIRGVILMAGSAWPGRQIMLQQNRQSLTAAGIPAARRDSIMALVPAKLDSVAATNAWIRFFMEYDPLPTIRRVRQPVLILQGETDQQVDPEQADLLASSLRAAGNTKVVLRKFASANHLFLNDPWGAPQGYASLGDRKLRRDVLGTLVDWVLETAGTR